MKALQILILCLIFSNILQAQKTITVLSEKDRKVKLADAQYLLLNEEYKKALVDFKDLATSDPSNANFNYLTAYCYLKLPFENGRSIPFLKKAIKKLSRTYEDGSSKETNAPLDALYLLGYAYHLNKGYSFALQYYKRFRDTLTIEDVATKRMVERQIESCVNAQELSKNPVPVEIENLGNYVNSKRGDFNPCVNAKGNVLIYTRIKEKEDDTTNLSVYSKKEYQIMQSTFDRNGKWTKAEDITDQLGYEGQLKTLSLSSDGSELILFKDNLEGGGPLSYRNGSIYYAKKKDEKWSKAKELNSNINSIGWESHASISPNGKELYFTSDRAGGYGGLDIYVSKFEHGSWGDAKNLGSYINTPFDEETPAILPDGKTLYFSSEGHNNMGGFDIFYSTKVDSLNWNEPVNLGSPINSTDDNLFYVPIEDGSRAFYSVARNEGYFTFGEEDIYELDIVVDSVHQAVIDLKGKISLRDLKNLDTSFTITYKTRNSKNELEIKTVKPNISSGTYEIKLKPQDYELTFSSNNYNSETRNLSLIKIKSNTPISLDVTLDPIVYDENKYITFNRIFFNFDNSALTNEAMNSLDKLYTVMNNNAGLAIEFTGHTDSRGIDKHSKDLALERAKKSVDYLVSKGIDPIRLIFKGEGTMIRGGDSLNRCAEIKILSSGNNSIVITDIETLKKLEKNNRYMIAIKDSKEPVAMSEFKGLFEDYPQILGLSYKDGYIYYFGSYKDQTQASVVLSNVHAKGYLEAKIIDFFYINKINNMDVTSKALTTKKYTIQVDATTKRSVIEKDIRLDTRERKSQDGIYRYYYKEYTKIEDAEKALDKIITLGYANAFILDMRDYK